MGGPGVSNDWCIMEDVQRSYAKQMKRKSNGFFVKYTSSMRIAGQLSPCSGPKMLSFITAATCAHFLLTT